MKCLSREELQIIAYEEVERMMPNLKYIYSSVDAGDLESEVIWESLKLVDNYINKGYAEDGVDFKGYIWNTVRQFGVRGAITRLRKPLNNEVSIESLTGDDNEVYGDIWDTVAASKIGTGKECEEKMIVADFLQSIPQPERDVYMMNLKGYSIKDSAKACKMNERTARRRLAKIHIKVGEQLC